MDLTREVDDFLVASVGDWTGKAARMLASTPELATGDVRTALVLGDADRVREALASDPGLATRAGFLDWTALHLVCASRWHSLDPGRADGLLTTARLLLDAGADPVGHGPRGGTPMHCAVAGVANPAIVALLIERGARPSDDDLYLACFGDDNLRSLRLLLEHAPDMRRSVALSAPISTGDTEAVRLLLQAGADPNRPLPPGGDDPPRPPLHEAIMADGPAELFGLLLEHGADPDAIGPDGRSPYRLAMSLRRTDLTALLRRHNARDDATDADRLVAACLEADEAAARRLLADHPGLIGELTDAELGAIVPAAGSGNTAALALMLGLGFPAETRGGDDGGTALHAAAFAGSAPAVRLLLGHGAPLETRDQSFDATPLDWAVVGSGFRPTSAPDPDWIGCVQALLDAGADTSEITLDPDATKPPSPEVARLLRDRGIGAATD